MEYRLQTNLDLDFYRYVPRNFCKIAGYIAKLVCFVVAQFDFIWVMCLYLYISLALSFTFNWRRRNPTKVCYKWLMIERKKEVYEWRRHYIHNLRLSVGCCCLEFHVCHAIKFAFQMGRCKWHQKIIITKTQTDETNAAEISGNHHQRQIGLIMRSTHSLFV